MNYWNDVRNQAAIAAMQALLSSPMWLNKMDNKITEAKAFYTTIATMAIQQADALLERLNIK